MRSLSARVGQYAFPTPWPTLQLLLVLHHVPQIPFRSTMDWKQHAKWGQCEVSPFNVRPFLYLPNLLSQASCQGTTYCSIYFDPNKAWLMSHKQLETTLSIVLQPTSKVEYQRKCGKLLHVQISGSEYHVCLDDMVRQSSETHHKCEEKSADAPHQRMRHVL